MGENTPKLPDHSRGRKIQIALVGCSLRGREHPGQHADSPLLFPLGGHMQRGELKALQRLWEQGGPALHALHAVSLGSNHHLPPGGVTPAMGATVGQHCPFQSGKPKFPNTLEEPWDTRTVSWQSGPVIPLPCQHRVCSLGTDAHLDTEEHSDEEHRHQEEEEEHEEPGAPVQPVAEAHHVHVLLWEVTVSPTAAPTLSRHGWGKAQVALPRGTSKEVAAPGTTR